MLFTGISMIIARLVANGDAAVAVQKVGSQIESISWMTTDGFAAAVNSFIAQNHGAGNRDRIRKGYSHAMGIVLVWGIFCTLLLILCPEPIFRIFITEPDVIPMGVDYLMILGVSQLFMSVEIYSRCIFRLRPYSTAVCHQHYIYLLANSSGDAADHNVTRLKRYLVEYNHFQYFQRDFTADLVFDLFKERNEKILIYFNDARVKSLNPRYACT